MEAVILIGIQSSGKSTFYRERFFDTHVRISRDMLKTRNRQSLLVSACLAGRQPFVVDDTNAAKSRRAEFIEPARAAGFRVRCFFFRCALREALGRNRRRPSGQVVPVPGVIATFKRLEPPVWQEGFDEISIVEVDAEDRFAVRDWTREQGDPPRLEREQG